MRWAPVPADLRSFFFSVCLAKISGGGAAERQVAAQGGRGEREGAGRSSTVAERRHGQAAAGSLRGRAALTAAAISAQTSGLRAIQAADNTGVPVSTITCRRYGQTFGVRCQRRCTLQVAPVSTASCSAALPRVCLCRESSWDYVDKSCPSSSPSFPDTGVKPMQLRDCCSAAVPLDQRDLSHRMRPWPSEPGLCTQG